MRTDTTLSITFGIVIGLLASFVQSLGLTIQRKSHVLNQSLPEHRQRVEHKRPLWLLGFAIFISSNVVGSFLQIASLPVVILAPLGAVSLLWNAFFARLLLGDVFSPWMILGTILIAGGAILIAFFGIVPEQTRSLEDLLALFRRPAFIAYFSVLGFIVVCCLIITHLTEFSLIRFMKQSSLPISPASSAIDLPTHSTDVHSNTLDLPPTERTPLVDPKPQTPFQSPNALLGNQSNASTVRSITRTRLLLAVSYASFSGIISGMCLLFAKSGVELLLLTLAGKNQFWRWEAWMLVLALIVFALLQLWYLHKALTLADPTLVCPSAFCFYNLSSIVNGLVYFNQFSLIPPLHLGLVVLGIIILLGGVWVVSIQSGGGGIDVGTWNEEPVILAGEDVALYPEEQSGEDRTLPSDEATVVGQPGARSTFGAVPMERGTVSEGSLPNISSSLATDLGLEQSQNTFMSPSKRPRLSSQLYSSPRTPSSRRVSQRTSADLQSSTSTSTLTQGHPRNVSFPAPSYSHAPLSPGLGTVSTLGPGFQIGLSPLSPGFTIMPVERRGRPTFADVAQGVVSDVQRRRRTVSEGQILPRVRDDVGAEGLPNPPALDGGHLHRHPAPDNHGKAKTRWQRLRGIITRKD